MIGEKVRSRRLELGMTQQELANKIGYKSRSAVNKIELGVNDVSQKTIMLLAEALDVSPAYFIDEVPYDIYTRKRLLTYARMLCKLSEKNQDSAVQYIKYLSDTEKQQQEQK